MITDVAFIDTGFCSHSESQVIQGGHSSAIKFPATVTVAIHAKLGVVLFDTGYAPRFYDATARFPEKLYQLVTPVSTDDLRSTVSQLGAMGIKAADVRHIVISHFHADHIAGILDFPKAKFYFLAEAFTRIQGLGRLNALRRGFLPNLLPTDFIERSADSLSAKFPVIPLDDFGDFKFGLDLVGDGSLIGISLPGHAAGHMGLSFHCKGVNYFAVGDAVWLEKNLRLGKSAPDGALRILFDDFAAYRKTFTALHSLYQQPDHPFIIPCHCSSAMMTLPRQLSQEVPSPS